jgi:hypothetical protein
MHRDSFTFYFHVKKTKKQASFRRLHVIYAAKVKGFDSQVSKMSSWYSTVYKDS